MLPSSLREKDGLARPGLYLRFKTRRYLVLAVIAFAVVTLFGRAFLAWFGTVPRAFRDAYPPPLPPPPAITSPLPPLYENYHHKELSLPQHHWDQRRPSKDEKFLFVAGHSRGMYVLFSNGDAFLIIHPGCGWGNAMQELLLNAYMAYKAGRSYVSSLTLCTV